MTDSAMQPMTAAALDGFLDRVRPKIHRYCARMTGSALDGEDVVQDAMIKAVAALQHEQAVQQPERWLFRIAHNTALDFLRRRARIEANTAIADLEQLVDAGNELEAPIDVETSLRTFMRLPAVQRSAVILMDVLGYPLVEIAEMTEASVAAVKSALHRGRTRLRSLHAEGDDGAPPPLDPDEEALLAAYVRHFNAREFDAVRALLADDVRLQLVSHLELNGRSDVERYFHNYDGLANWRMELAVVDGVPAIVVLDLEGGDAPSYIVRVDWRAGRIVRIRDFRHAEYAVTDFLG